LYCRILFPIVLFSLILTSCVDDELAQQFEFADIELVMKGRYDGSPLVKNRPYAYKDGSRIRFSDFTFFVSNLTTIVNADESFALDEVEYVDLTLFQGDIAAEEGYKLNVGRAPTGDYSGFSFGIGVPPELNRTTTDEYGANHPLGSQDRYDESLNGFKFLVIAGEVDYNSDGNFDENFNFTIGFNQNYKKISSTEQIEVLPDITNKIEIEIDLMKVLDSGIRAIDFSTQLKTTKDPLDDIMLLLNSNFDGAITVN